MLNRFFKFIFKFKQGEPFDPKLIHQFHKDHQKLVSIALDIKHQTKRGGNDILIKTLLKTLKVEILIHFAHEEKTLYKYLNVLYKNDTANKALVDEFNTSMHKIQDVVEKFMDKYTVLNVKYDENFSIQLDNIIDALANRIDTEENHLYTLYNKKITNINDKDFQKIELDL